MIDLPFLMNSIQLVASRYLKSVVGPGSNIHAAQTAKGVSIIAVTGEGDRDIIVYLGSNDYLNAESTPTSLVQHNSYGFRLTTLLSEQVFTCQASKTVWCIAEVCLAGDWLRDMIIYISFHALLDSH